MDSPLPNRSRRTWCTRLACDVLHASRVHYVRTALFVAVLVAIALVQSRQGMTEERPARHVASQSSVVRLPPVDGRMGTLPVSDEETGKVPVLRISSLPSATGVTINRSSGWMPDISRLPPVLEIDRLPPVMDEAAPAMGWPTLTGPQPANTPTAAHGQETLPSAVGVATDAGRAAWWHEAIGQQIRAGYQTEKVDLNGLILGALANSPRVRAISEQPRIEETAIFEAAAAFDPTSFIESKYVSLSDPVGNTLTTGGPSRFRQQDYQLSAGIRKKNATGGMFELGQKIGKLHNNSVFFVPPEQGNAKLSLSYTQPMLRGAGRVYNTSLIVLAELDTTIAADQASAQIQDHLLEVARAYGTLQLQRAALLQKRRLAQQAQDILKELEARQELDAMQSQIARARAALALRRAQLVRCETEILNAETRIRNLVGAPSGNRAPNLELVPVMTEHVEPINVSLDDAFVTAVRNRPELDEAIKQTRASELRVGMAASDVLSSLDFVLETYVAGLAGNYQTATAFGDQFSQGQPGFNVGFVFESPWGSRAAQAKLQRRELESRQAMHHFRDTLSTLLAEVEVAVREIDTARREIDGQWQAMQAAATDIQFMEERWRYLPGDDGRRSFLLEDLLRAQERLTGVEYEFALAQFRYTTAIAELKRATGTLLKREEPNEIPPEVELFIP
jgi:outer membrane protein TolC